MAEDSMHGVTVAGGTTALSRRRLLRIARDGAVASAVLASGPTLVAGGAQADSRSYLEMVPRLPKLFCLAFITPTLPDQAGQEAIIAKYPLALVPQDTRPPFLRWRDKIRTLNPRILLLGYLDVNKENRVPGPGHDRMRAVQSAWIEGPFGIVPQVRGMRLFDPRRPEWSEAFLEAATLTLRSYPYDGLFLDNCSVFGAAHPSPSVRSEMRAALQDTLIRLRGQHPRELLVGNCRENWTGLNGEMNEDRPKDWPAELAAYAGQNLPRVDLAQTYARKAINPVLIEADMRKAHNYGAFFGVSVNAQHVLWFDFFDDVVAAAGH